MHAVPTNIKNAKGTDQRCRTNPNEPKPATDGIKTPRGMSKKSRAVWRQTLKMLQECKVMTVMDVDAVKLYCNAMVRYQEANEDIVDVGMVIKSPSGYPVINPSLSIAHKAEDVMIKIMKEFGMTPSSRTKVSTVGKKGDGGGGFSDL